MIIFTQFKLKLEVTGLTLWQLKFFDMIPFFVKGKKSNSDSAFGPRSVYGFFLTVTVK